MAEAYPAEFRQDVVRIARKRELPLTQIAKDFGISNATLRNWLKQADIEDGSTRLSSAPMGKFIRFKMLISVLAWLRSGTIPSRSIC